jgi:predicted nuclease of predicted toxin-antitoxin system
VKLLLDNCVHYRAKSLFPGHEVTHARDVGWRALSNGELLAQAAKQFNVLVTTDKNIRNEHNLARLPISVLELNTRFTRIEDLRTLAPFLEVALAACGSYRFISVKADGTMDKLGLISTE